MGDTVKLVRPDGSTLDVSSEQADRLRLLGYKELHEETDVERTGRLENAAREDYYTSFDQRVETAVEGLGRGASLGLTDYAFGDEDTNQRAKYNPGIAAATEIAGAVGAEFIPGINVIAPAAMVGRGARAAVKGTGVGKSLVRGAVEGGVFGGAAAADHAYLKGDPITSEAVLHGVGWGALFGAGLSAGGAALLSRGAKNAAAGSKLVSEGEAMAAQAAASKPGSYAAATEPAFTAFRTEAKRMAGEIKDAVRTTAAVLSGDVKEMASLGFARTMPEGALGKARIAIDDAFDKVNKAFDKENFNPDRLAEAIEMFEDTAAKVVNKAGLTQTGSGKQALMEYAQAKILQKELDRFPVDTESFAKMSPKRAETLFATLSSAKKLSNYSQLGQALDDHANAFQEALGVNPTGVDGLRSAWQIAKKQIKAEKAASRAPQAEESSPSIARRVVAAGAGFLGFKAVAATGHPIMAMGAASKVRNWVLNKGTPKTPELIAARNQSLGRIKMAVGKYQGKGGKAVQAVGPKLSPLAIRLDGEVDTTTKDPQKLAENRVREFAAAAPHVKDTLFRGIEPIAVEQPELGPGLHASAVASFNAMRSMLPADPGVVSGLKSIWKPSSLQAAVMSRQLSVFQDPVGAAEEMLATDIYDPIRVKALKEIAPAAFDHLRVEMIERIQEAGFLDKMTYRQQVALGSMLDIPIHSSMKPEYIAASQALHTTRSQPLPTPSIPGSTNGGRPAADNPGATQAQVSTSR